MNILLTSIGSMSAESIITSFRKRNDIQIIGCDIYPKEWIPSSLYVDCFYQVPLSVNKKYVTAIHNICRDHKIDLVFPLTDPEVDALVNEVDFFREINTTICVSPIKAIKVSRSKLGLYEFFRDSNIIKTIPTYKYEQLNYLGLNNTIVAKKDNGRSSEGLRIIENPRELKYGEFEDYIFQPFISGDIFTVDFIQDSCGNSFSISRKELLRTKNGAGITVELAENSLLTKLAYQIGKELDLLGCVNIEFIFDGQNYYLMDINPRFSAGIAFSTFCGYDFALNAIKCFNKQEIDSSVSFENKIICKKFIEVIM